MKGFSCPDIDTGWKPVIHEDSQNARADRPSLIDNVDEDKHAEYDMPATDAQIREILRMLGEIQRETASLKQMIKGMDISCRVPEGRKGKPRKRRLAKKLTAWGEVDHVRNGEPSI